MKLQTVAFLTAFAACASYASATECNITQLSSLQVKDDGSEFETACPVLFKDGGEVLDPTDESSFTKEALEAIAPCKAATCTAYLSKLTDQTPDCSVLGVNVKSLYGAVLTLCKKFAAGPVTEADVEKIFKDVIGSSPLLEIGAANSTGSTTTTNTTNNTTTTNTTTNTATTNTTSTTSPATTSPAQADKDSMPAASSTMPTPTPTSTKSSATVLTGVAAIATATIFSAFLV